MNTQFRYGSIMEAMDYLHAHGYDKDFRLEGEELLSGDKKYNAEDLQIEVTYRYEGATNPGDESTVYGIATTTGEKGILIVSEGIYSNSASTGILRKLHEAKNEGFR